MSMHGTGGTITVGDVTLPIELEDIVIKYDVSPLEKQIDRVNHLVGVLHDEIDRLRELTPRDLGTITATFEPRGKNEVEPEPEPPPMTREEYDEACRREAEMSKRHAERWGHHLPDVERWEWAKSTWPR